MTAPAPVAECTEEAAKTRSSALAWLGQALASESAEVASCARRLESARAESLAAQAKLDELRSAYARDSSAATWKAIVSAREAAEQADVRLTGAANDHNAATARLADRERVDLRRARAELAMKACGSALPLDALRDELVRVLADLDVLAQHAEALAANRNACARGVAEITRYLGDEEAFLSAPPPLEAASGWAARAGIGRHSTADVRHVVSSALLAIGPGGRGSYGSPLRRFIKALEVAGEPSPPPPTPEASGAHEEQPS